MAKYSYYSVLNRQTHTCAHSASLSHVQEPTGPPTRPGTSILHSRLHIDEKMIRNKTRLKPYHPLLWGLKKRKTRQTSEKRSSSALLLRRLGSPIKSQCSGTLPNIWLNLCMYTRRDLSQAYWAIPGGVAGAFYESCPHAYSFQAQFFYGPSLTLT